MVAEYGIKTYPLTEPVGSVFPFPSITKVIPEATMLETEARVREIALTEVAVMVVACKLVADRLRQPTEEEVTELA